ncbi:MAG: low affinity iron permease family protein [Bdellovibrionota bacterium]
MEMVRSKRPTAINRAFGTIANNIAREAGRPLTFITALAIVLAWGATGPMFHYSDTWQLVINTGTTIITFLVVFLIQNSQNRDGAAIQVKLDELVRAGAAKNFFVGIEHLTDDEIRRLRDIVEKKTKSPHVKATEKKAEEAAERTD